MSHLEVYLRIPRCTSMQEKGSTLALKPRTVTSHKGAGPQKKDLCQPKIKKKNWEMVGSFISFHRIMTSRHSNGSVLISNDTLSIILLMPLYINTPHNNILLVCISCRKPLPFTYIDLLLKFN